MAVSLNTHARTIYCGCTAVEARWHRNVKAPPTLKYLGLQAYGKTNSGAAKNALDSTRASTNDASFRRVPRRVLTRKTL